MKKRFSLRFKLILVFGLLIAMASIVEGFLAVRTARKAVTEKVETHLIDKALDTAEVIDGRITAMFQFLDGITRMPIIQDASVSYQEKMKYLAKETQFNTVLKESILPIRRVYSITSTVRQKTMQPIHGL